MKLSPKKVTLTNADTIVCVASGSIDMSDIALLRERAPGRIVAVNDAYTLFDTGQPVTVYATDYPWIQYHWDRVQSKFGSGFTICPVAAKEFGWNLLPCVDVHQAGEGLSNVAGAIVCGGSSGYAGLHYAIDLAPKRVFLLGYEYGGNGHFFGKHPDHLSAQSDWTAMLKPFPALAAQVQERGIEIINCSSDSAITCFKRMPLAEALY